MGLDGLLPTSRAPDATIEYLLEPSSERSKTSTIKRTGRSSPRRAWVSSMLMHTRKSKEVGARMSCDFLPKDRDDDIDTIGGVVASLADGLPQRGEITARQSGIEFEITEGDARRVKWLRTRRVKSAPGGSSASTKAVSEVG